MTDLPPPPAWRPDPHFYDIAAEGDDVELADAPPRHVAGAALPPLDASVIDATMADGTDAMPVTRVAERVDDAPTDQLRALAQAYRHAPAGIAHAWRRAFHAPPVVHPEQWKLDALRPNYASQAAMYERVQAAQAEELKTLRAEAAERRRQAITSLTCAVAFGAVAAVIGLAFFTTAACLIVSMIVPAALYGFGIAHNRRVLADAQAREAALPPRAPDAPTASDDAPPPRVELTRETITTALRNAKVIGDAIEIHVRPARPMRTNGEPNGWKVRVELPPSVKGGASKALAEREDIAFAFDREPCCVVMEPVKGRGLAFDLWVAERDPMACAPVISPLVTAERSNIHRPCLVGWTAGGERAMVRVLDDVHALLTGATGSGKSSVAAILTANGALYPFSQAIIIDPQHSARWMPYAAYATVISGTDPDAQRLAARTIEWLAGPEMDRRGLAFAEHVRLNPLASPEDVVTEDMMRNPALGLHHVLIIIDEAHTVLGFSAPVDANDDSSPTCAQVINDGVQQIVTRSRRIGMNAVLVTQRGSTTNVKGDIRSILNSRGCFSVADEDTAKMGLGAGWKAQGMDPVNGLSTSENKGAAYLTGEWLKSPARPWVLAKMDHIDVTGHQQIARRGLALRQAEAPWVLDWVPEPVARARRAETRPAPPMPVERTPDQLLAALGAVLEPEGSLHASAIVARLAADDPDAYARTPATRQGLDALVAPLGLRCERFQRAGVRDYGLRYSSLPAAAPGACQADATGTGLAEGWRA